VALGGVLDNPEDAPRRLREQDVLSVKPNPTDCSNIGHEPRPLNRNATYARARVVTVTATPRLAPGARVHHAASTTGTMTNPCSLKPIAASVRATMAGPCHARGWRFNRIHTSNARGIPTMV
jgi:hypothetical protein